MNVYLFVDFTEGCHCVGADTKAAGCDMGVTPDSVSMVTVLHVAMVIHPGGHVTYRRHAVWGDEAENI